MKSLNFNRSRINCRKKVGYTYQPPQLYENPNPDREVDYHVVEEHLPSQMLPKTIMNIRLPSSSDFSIENSIQRHQIRSSTTKIGADRRVEFRAELVGFSSKDRNGTKKIDTSCVYKLYIKV